nr:hypothetical protein [Tanacetum cinerariifolium]
MGKKTVTGDVLNAKVDEVVGGEMVLGKTITGDATPKKKKRKRNKKMKKVVGDILSAKVDEMMSGKTVPDKARIDTSSSDLHERQMRFFRFPDDDGFIGYWIVATLVQNDYVTMTPPQEVTMFTHEYVTGRRLVGILVTHDVTAENGATGGDQNLGSAIIEGETKGAFLAMEGESR